MADRSTEFGYVVDIGTGYALSMIRGDVDFTPAADDAIRLTQEGAKQLAGMIKLRYKALARARPYAAGDSYAK